jgi:hypothetical protein
MGDISTHDHDGSLEATRPKKQITFLKIVTSIYFEKVYLFLVWMLWLMPLVLALIFSRMFKTVAGFNLFAVFTLMHCVRRLLFSSRICLTVAIEKLRKALQHWR